MLKVILIEVGSQTPITRAPTLSDCKPVNEFGVVFSDATSRFFDTTLLNWSEGAMIGLYFAVG
jgi:hypothetical protein